MIRRAPGVVILPTNEHVSPTKSGILILPRAIIIHRIEHTNAGLISRPRSLVKLIV